MKCIFCSNPDTNVVETRLSDDGMIVRRRRECGKCLK
ncbi:MAG: transcriptional regulator NrdR, partial [Candidatus Omnitrophota bacterium]